MSWYAEEEKRNNKTREEENEI